MVWLARPRVVNEAIPAALDGERLDRLVAMLAGVSRADASRLLAAGAVRVDGEVAHTGKQRLQEGQVVEIDTDLHLGRDDVTADPSVTVDVVFSDDAVIVVDKPAGLVVHPGAGHDGGTLVTHSHRIQTVGQPPWRGLLSVILVRRLRRNARGMVQTLHNLARLAGAPGPTNLEVSWAPPAMTDA